MVRIGSLSSWVILQSDGFSAEGGSKYRSNGFSKSNFLSMSNLASDRTLKNIGPWIFVWNESNKPCWSLYLACWSLSDGAFLLGLVNWWDLYVWSSIPLYTFWHYKLVWQCSYNSRVIKKLFSHGLFIILLSFFCFSTFSHSSFLTKEPMTMKECCLPLPLAC